MKEFRGIWFPDRESHVIEWMQRNATMIGGKGTYQYQKYAAALKLVPKERRRVAIDVGANVGLWSRVMAMDFQKVIAFEPVGEYAECWRRTMDDVTNEQDVTLHEIALGHEAGYVQMEQTTPGSCGDTAVKPGGVPSGATHNVAEMRTLDSYGIRSCNFLKLDNEGYEYFVLRGAVQTIQRCRPVIVVEQKPGHGARFGIGDTDGANWLIRHMGYRQWDVMNGDYIMVPI